MSTRGCVGVYSSDRKNEWRGVFNGSDSYPTWLMKEELWPLVANKSIPELKAFARSLFEAGRFENVIQPGAYEIERDENGDNLNLLTSHDADPLFIEWVYVIDPEQQALHILASQGRNKNRSNIRTEPIVDCHGTWDHGHWEGKHVEMANISLTGPEPDWEVIHNARQSQF